MSDDNHSEEENTARLIAAGFGPEARPGLRIRAATLQRLRSRLGPRRAATAFPEHILCLLLGMLVLMAAWSGTDLMKANSSFGDGVTSLVCLAAALLNLAFVPVAGFVIVIRRRNVQSIQEDAA